MAAKRHKWLIFHCDKDDCWIVSRLQGDMAIGVAECPDRQTARAVLEAMRDRDKKKGTPPNHTLLNDP